MRQNVAICPKCGTKFHRWGHMQVFDEGRMRKMLERRGFEILISKILPIGLMATHHFLKYSIPTLKKFGFFSQGNLFVIAVKI
jgi:hypothetical protein